MSTPTTVWVEVTNTVSVPFTTGLQRLTRELLARLPGPDTTDGPLRVVPIRWCPRRRNYRRLTAAEAARLSHAPSRTAPATPGWADRLPAGVTRTARRLARVPGAASARRAVGLGPTRPDAHPELEIGRWPRGSIFLDLEAAWHDPRSRAELLPELAEAGVISALLVADVLPETHPEWFDSAPAGLFRAFLRAHLRHSAAFLCISDATRHDLAVVAADIGVTRPIAATTITLGADFDRPGEPAPLPVELASLRYLLDVSTLEPRKNHAALLDAFDSIQSSYPDLAVVLVGKAGWKTEGLVERLERHPLRGRRLFWYDAVDDDLLDTLYAHAFVAVTPSFSEGFGAPVVEALAHGVPTIASSGGALPEAGGELADYFDPDEPEALARLIERHLFDGRWHQARRDELAGYRAPTWADCAAAVIDALVPLAG